MVIPVALFLIALGARVLGGALFPDPAYPDSFYYVAVARELAAGHGFQVGYIWDFVDVGGSLPTAGVLPIPSNAHWMPLAAIVQVPFIWLLGAVPLASALPFWIASAATAPLTWLIGRDAGLQSWQAVAAGLMVAMPALVSPFLAQPDNFGLFMLLGTLALWLCARGLRGDRRAFALGGVVVGLAFLSRNDGVLLGVPFALAFLADLLRRPSASRIGWPAALICAGTFLLVAAPWVLRQLDVFGSVSPSAASGRILWITEYRDLYSISSPATPESFLAQGIGPLVMSRILGLVNALGLFATQPLLLFLAPVAALGAWWRRRDAAFQPWIVYAVTLFLASGLVFAVHVPNGTFLHSAVALIPYAYLASVVGIAGVVRAIARRRPSWDAARATRVFTAMAVATVVVISVVATVLTARTWQRAQDVALAVTAPLADVPSDERIMSPDAGAFWYLAGREGVVTPEDPLPVVEDVLRRYDVRWLILERQFMTRDLAPVLEGSVRPAWLSRPIAVVPGSGPAGPVDPAASPLPDAALYAVCLDAGDQRCAS
jgi:4-amino-4-deoxy-L-arabinose transferase-like glycosyltransferase